MARVAINGFGRLAGTDPDPRCPQVPVRAVIRQPGHGSVELRRGEKD